MGFITGGYNSSKTSNQFQNSMTGSSDTNRNLLPEQAQTAPDIFATLHRYLTDPEAAVNPARMAARNQVNQNYSGLADRVRQKFLTTGGGQSGKSGQAMLQGELGRTAGLSDVDMAAQQQAATLPLTATQLAEAFLGINLGEKTDVNQQQSGTSSGSSSGWGIGAQVGWSPGGGFNAAGR